MIATFMNAFQQYIAELLDEYGALLSRQLLAAVNHKFAVELPNIDGYAAQMCRYGDYEKTAYGGEFILCRKHCEPDYDIIRAFDVMLSFQPQVVWHRRSREPVAIRFFVSTLKHDKEMLVIPVKPGDEREISAYAVDKFDNNPCEVVIFLLESKEQMKRIHVNCNCRFALITSGGVKFFKK